MKHVQRALIFAAVLIAPISVALAAALRRMHQLHSFKKLQLSDKFFCEGASFGDFNHDGVMDVVSGPVLVRRANFTDRHEYYTAEAVRYRRLLG